MIKNMKKFQTHLWLDNLYSIKRITSNKKNLCNSEGYRGQRISNNLLKKEK